MATAGRPKLRELETMVSVSLWLTKNFQWLLANVAAADANTILLLKTSMCIHPCLTRENHQLILLCLSPRTVLSDSAANTQYIYASNRHSRLFKSTQRFYNNQGNFFFGVVLVFKHPVPPWHKSVAPRHYSQLCLEHLNGKAQGG